MRRTVSLVGEMLQRSSPGEGGVAERIASHILGPAYATAAFECKPNVIHSVLSLLRIRKLLKDLTYFTRRAGSK